MNIEISKEKKLAQFIGVPIFVSVLLLFIVFAAPAYSRIGIDPPRVAAHHDLEPNGLPVLFINGWYCTGVGLDENRKKVEALWRTINAPIVNGQTIFRDSAAQDLMTIAKKYLGKEKLSADKFWGASSASTINLDPPQGSTVSHTWDHCYTKAELEAYKREAIRWAHYILDNYIPKNFPNYKE